MIQSNRFYLSWHRKNHTKKDDKKRTKYRQTNADTNMTLQQMEYIVAVDNHRHFARAAQSCGVTQSTLSSLIQKLETELDVIIFDRNSHPIKPTDVGVDIIRQARDILHSASQMRVLIDSKRRDTIGQLKLGLSTSITPFILPKLLKHIYLKVPDIHLKIADELTDSLLKKLENDDLDVVITPIPITDPKYLVIPIYKERFVAYISNTDPLFKKRKITTAELSDKQMWIFHDGLSLQTTPNTSTDLKFIDCTFGCANIDTILSAIDEIGGLTIIPEWQVNKLCKQQRHKVKYISPTEPFREVSFVVKNNFIRQDVLNLLADTIKEFVNPDLIDEHLKKFPIRL